MAEQGGHTLPAREYAARLRDAQALFTSDRGVLDWVVSASGKLAEVVTGKQSALETLFPGGDTSLAEGAYEHSAISAYFNSIVASVAGAARPLRIFEIGAGTGATTAAVLPKLGRDAEYWFTDISALFLTRATKKFEARPQLRTALFNVDHSPASQDLPGGHFDVVIATNALHAAADIRGAVRNAASLLRNDGILLLCEVTRVRPFFDITTALLEGWSHFQDGLRNEHPILSAGGWQALLESEGFDGVTVVPESGTPAAELGQHVACGVRTAARGVHSQADAQAEAPQRETAAPQCSRPPRSRVEEILCEEIAQLVEQPAETLDRECGLIDLGLDSLMAIELRTRLTRRLECKTELPEP